MANNVGRLGVVLGLDTAEFIAGIATAERMLVKFGTAVEKYGKMAGVAMAAAGLNALAFADELGDVAKANDTTIESVLRLQQALAANGGEAENAGKIYSGFTKYIDEAAHGSMDAQKRLASMGITLKDIATLGTQDLFNKAITGSAGTADTITRNANAYAVFGRAIKGTDLKGLAQDLSNANPLAKEQAENIQKAADAWGELKKITLETNAVIAGAIGPSILALIDFMKDLRGESSLLGDTFRITFETFVVLIAATTHRVQDLASAFGQLRLLMTVGPVSDEEQKKWEAIQQKREDDLAKYEAFVKRVMGEQDFLTGEKKPKYFEGHLGVKVPSTLGGDGRPAVDAFAKETAQLTAKVALQEKLFDIEQDTNYLRLLGINGDKTKVDLLNVELQLDTQLANIANARAQALANEKLNADQRRLVNRDFNLQEQKATDKAANDSTYIKDIAKATALIYAQQATTRHLILDVDKEIAAQQLSSMNMDKLQADTQINGLQLRKEILRINQQEAEDLLKTNQSDAERANISAKAQDDRNKAVEVFQQTNAVVTRQYQDQLEAVGRLRAAQDEAYEFDVRRQILEQNRYHMRADEIKLAEEQIASEQKIADLLRQQMEARRTMGAGALGDAEAERIDDLIAKEKQLSEVRKKAIKDEYARTKSFSEGWNDAYRKYIENATNAAEVGGRAFNSVMGNMESALDNFVDTGKLSFSDLANSIIKDLIKIELKAQATQLMGGLMGGGGGGGGLMGMVSGLFSGGGGGGGMMGMIGSIGSMFGFADGGTPPTNVPSIVGERGPELFVPKTAGTVIPNNQLASALGGGGQTVNYNGPFIASMSAIDTQSGVQFLAKNKQTIWASYQSANRSVPVSR
jgi:lambda family phage tail tape measure protein